MPRNGSGVASIINNFTPGTTADANQVNANFDDVAAMITDSLPRDGQAGMIGQFRAIDGTVTDPGVAFNSDADTGIRRTGANSWAVVCGGVDIVTFNTSGMAVNTGAISGGSNLIQPGMSMIWNSQTVPSGWHEEDGAALLIATYPTLAANIYVGNALNPTAAWGYKCTDPLNPSTTRSTSGTYIVLPDSRGEFMRGWDHGKGTDAARAWASAQADVIKNHVHPIPANAIDVQTTRVQASTTNNLYKGGSLDTTEEYAVPASATSNNTDGSAVETRPRNLARMFIIYIGGN